MTFEGMRILFDRWGAKRRVKSEAHWLEASIRAANPLVESGDCRAVALAKADVSISDLANQ